MSQLLNEEIQRMQHLAGITPSKSLFEKFIDGETEYKTLKEFMSFLNEETTQAAIDAAKEYLEKLEDQGQGNILAAGEKVANALSGIDNLTRDTLGAKINTFFKSKGDQIKKSIFGATMALVMLAHSLGPSIPVGSKTYTVKTKGNTELVQANNQLNQNLQPIVVSDQDDLNQASNQNPEYDDTTTNTDLHIQHKTGESGISQQDNQQIDDYTDAITSAVLDDGMDIDLTVKSGDSNNGNKFSNVSKSGGKLDQERNDNVGDEVTDKLVKSFQKKGAKITKTEDGLKVEKNGKTHTVKITKKLINWVKNKVTSANDKNPTQSSELTAKATSADTEKVVKSFKFLDFVENPRLPGEIPVGKRGDDKPRPTGDDKEPKTDTDRANVADKVGQEKSGAGESKNGQRNTQLAIILNMANDTANTFKELGVPYSTRLTQSVLNKAESGKAKDLADLIVAIRKNPDYFLKKVSNVTGQSIGQRTKQTNRFAESLQLEALLHEGKIDDLLLKVGITDNDIKANADVIIKSLTKIYGLGSAAPTSSTEPKTSRDTTSTTSTTKDKISFDAKTLLKDINNNTLLKSRLKLIDNDQELIDLLSTLTDYVNTNLSKTQLKSAFTSTSNKVKSMKEEEEKETTDSYAVKDIIEKNTLLKQHLNNINTPQEFSDLLVTMLMFIDPSGKITKDRQRIARLIFSAQNQIKRK